MRLLLFLLALSPLTAKIKALYLTWFDDPTTTMTLQWIAPADEPKDTLYLHPNNTPLKSHSRPLSTYLVYDITLTQLTPDTTYEFHIGDDPTPHTFRTAPADLTTPLHFIIGGDVYGSKKLFRRMNKTVTSTDPLFCVLGGDLAYALNTGNLRFGNTLDRWLDFLSEWTQELVAPDGRHIPFLLVSGNHDITPDKYQLFFTLFAYPKKQLYRALDFGTYLTLLLLDTGHFQPIEGRQTTFLKNALNERLNIPYRFAIYHEAAYPSYYPYNGTTPQTIRTHWCPLFDQYGITAAFENHNHTLSRTYPIKDGKLDPTGTIYFGDGCWGVKPRRTNSQWYLAERARKNNVYLLKLTPETAQVTALDISGQELFSISYTN